MSPVYGILLLFLVCWGSKTFLLPEKKKTILSRVLWNVKFQTRRFQFAACVMFYWVRTAKPWWADIFTVETSHSVNNIYVYKWWCSPFEFTNENSILFMEKVFPVLIHLQGYFHFSKHKKESLSGLPLLSLSL